MKSKIFVIAAAVLMLAGGEAGAFDRAVPNVISYQASLFDDGGNPLADGEANVSFRVSDAAGQILYEEYQTVNIVRGQAAVLVGNGVTRNGSPAGGIPLSVFDPTGSKYLEVQVGELPPTSAMEIATVPYAAYAEVALGAVDGSISGTAIADGSVAYEDLSADLISRLSSDITGGRGTDQIVFRSDMDELYRSPSSAAAIGIRPGLIYSGANDLQGAIQDIDRAVKRRDERIDAEARTREEANTSLQTNIDNEANTRTAADANLQTNITNEINARSAADLTLQTNINNEASARSGADSTLQTSINNEASARSGADSTLQTNINNEESARSSADSALESAKVSKSGDTMSGNLVIDAGSNISLGGVSRSNWPGFQSITHRSNSLSFGDATGWVGCVLTDDIYFCQTFAPCLVGEVLLGCSGYSNRVCAEGGGDADMCDFMGAWPSGNSCYAKAAQHGVGDLTTLQAHAICGRLYN